MWIREEMKTNILNCSGGGCGGGSSSEVVVVVVEEARNDRPSRLVAGLYVWHSVSRGGGGSGDGRGPGGGL